jgi:inhibitor of KinA
MNAENRKGYEIYTLGDSAITIEFGKFINPETNDHVIARFKQFQENPIKGVLDLIPSYHSLTLCYDLSLVAKQKMGLNSLIDQVKSRLEEPMQLLPDSSKLHEIPVVYGGKNGSDLIRVSQEKGIDLHEIIRLHAEPTYRVYMLGFIPGFAYLGELDLKLTMPRKSSPQPMIPGSIGIAGLQTGIYPSFSPGGWNIIGHTDYPLLNNGLPILQAGDRVKFIPKNQL